MQQEALVTKLIRSSCLTESAWQLAEASAWQLAEAGASLSASLLRVVLSLPLPLQSVSAWQLGAVVQVQFPRSRLLRHPAPTGRARLPQV